MPQVNKFYMEVLFLIIILFYYIVIMTFISIMIIIIAIIRSYKFKLKVLLNVHNINFT